MNDSSFKAQALLFSLPPLYDLTLKHNLLNVLLSKDSKGLSATQANLGGSSSICTYKGFYSQQLNTDTLSRKLEYQGHLDVTLWNHGGFLRNLQMTASSGKNAAGKNLSVLASWHWAPSPLSPLQSCFHIQAGATQTTAKAIPSCSLHPIQSQQEDRTCTKPWTLTTQSLMGQPPSSPPLDFR